MALFKEGVFLEGELSRSLEDAMDQAVADRLLLAESFLMMGDRLRATRGPLWRAAIGRYYYSMYHAMRAAAVQYHRGDDYQDHSTLSQKGVPSDFPSAAVASNALKDARILRNEADYDPYPADETYFRSAARNLGVVARPFFTDARAYVRAKGNPHA